jgi:DNA-binding NarL/FixJ family response regulator
VKTTGPYKVLMVDDHHMLRLGLRALSQVGGQLAVDWLEAGNLDDAIRVYGEHPDISLVLLDLNLPDSKGLQGLKQFQAAHPHSQVAIFSATEDEFVVRQALALGAIGFLPKSASGEATLRLVESLLAGLSAVQAHGSRSPHGRAAAPGPGLGLGRHPRTATLTPTQLRVLELVLAGMSNQEIAAECKLAVGTVKNTVSSIMLALDVHSRSHLISVF